MYPQVFQGTAALELLFSTVGLGWAVNLMELPIISKLVDLLYEFLSANRISLGNALVSEQCQQQQQQLYEFLVSQQQQEQQGRRVGVGVGDALV
jgi:predicted DCC family thiol-disulfide oxidoreductase YuxK